MLWPLLSHPLTILDNNDSKPPFAGQLVEYSVDKNLANVRDNKTEFFIAWVVDYFDSLPQSQNNRIGKTASALSMYDSSVEAAIAYRDQYPVTVEARIAMNKIQEGSPDVREGDKEAIEKILFLGKDKKDPFVPWDNE